MRNPERKLAIFVLYEMCVNTRRNNDLREYEKSATIEDCFMLSKTKKKKKTPKKPKQEIQVLHKAKRKMAATKENENKM